MAEDYQGNIGPYDEEDEYDESCYDSEYDEEEVDCIGECKTCPFVQACINDGNIEACTVCNGSSSD